MSGISNFMNKALNKCLDEAGAPTVEDEPWLNEDLELNIIKRIVILGEKHKDLRNAFERMSAENEALKKTIQEGMLTDPKLSAEQIEPLELPDYCIYDLKPEADQQVKDIDNSQRLHPILEQWVQIQVRADELLPGDEVIGIRNLFIVRQVERRWEDDLNPMVPEYVYFETVMTDDKTAGLTAAFQKDMMLGIWRKLP